MSSKDKDLFPYSPLEERWNVYTHALGLVASVVGCVFLLFRASGQSIKTVVSALVFGSSLCLLYLASTLYHKASQPARRKRLKIFDHAAIFVLIAGTYTPVTLITLEGTLGWPLFMLTWSIAALGIILKLFFTGRFDILSTVLYVAMGWIIVFAYSTLKLQLHPEGMWWLFAGGISYTVGALFYTIKHFPFNHAIFHLFVLGGSFCHFVMIYEYVLLSRN